VGENSDYASIDFQSSHNNMNTEIDEIDQNEIIKKFVIDSAKVDDHIFSKWGIEKEDLIDAVRYYDILNDKDIQEFFEQ
jgi:hypothetical protein